MLSTEQKQFINTLLHAYPTEVLVKKERLSKHGDYRFSSNTNKHQITINGNLHNEAFFFVLIHEIAHRICFDKFKRKAEPHGKEWKKIFQELLLSALDKKLFDEKIVELIHDFSHSPKSVVKISSPLHQVLFKVATPNSLTVADIEDGDLFSFRKRHFIKVEKKRTRIVCRDLQSGKLYLFNPQTPISATEKPQ